MIAVLILGCSANIGVDSHPESGRADEQGHAESGSPFTEPGPGRRENPLGMNSKQCNSFDV